MLVFTRTVTYLQIPVDKKSTELEVISTHQGLYKFK